MAVSAPVVDQTGKAKGSVDLPAEIFEAPINEALLHQALVRQQANARQGTHDTKTRDEVRGGGRKPYKQKGTGRARQGSTRSPQFAGGGIVFGPHPRSYRLDMLRKQRRLALRSALAVKAQEGQLRILDGFTLESPRTREVAAMLAAIDAGRRVLVVLGSHNEMLERSARNIPE